MNIKKHLLPTLLITSTVLLGAACSSSDNNTTGNIEATPSGYVACGLIFTADGPTSYATIVPDLEAVTTIDLATTLPLPSFSTCAIQGSDLFVGSGEGPEIIKYSINSDGSFTEQETVSLLNEGVAAISARPGRLQVVSATKGYYVDAEATLQVIIWNPSTMEIVDTIPLADATPVDGESVGISPVVKVGDKLLAVGGYNNGTINTSEVFVAAIDTRDDSVNVVSSQTCGGSSNTSVIPADDGHLYIANGARTSAYHRLGVEGAHAPCMVRFDPETETFDNSYLRALNDMTGTLASGELASAGGNGAYILGYNETLGPITGETSDQVMISTPAWEVYFIEDLASSTTVTKADGFAPTAGAMIAQVIDGTPYYVKVAANFSATTLFDITDPANPVEGISPPGALIAIAPFFGE